MNAYRKAIKEITDARRSDLDAGLELWRTALRDNEKLHAAYVKYQEEAIKRARKLPHELETAQKELNAAAKEIGLKKSMIEPPCRCKKCNDTGIVNGHYCSCVVKRVINSDGDNLLLPQIDFDRAKSTAPKAIAKVYAAAEKYIADFESQTKPFFIIVGSSGTGKTILAAAMTTAFMEKGASAVTVSAFDFVKRAKDYHTQFAIENYYDSFTPMLDCDLLCIDDLGTETLLKNITKEYFYTVVNERYMRKKHTIVTTNLTPDAMLTRYGEAIFSRLCDRSLSNLFLVTAKNSRI